MNEDLSRLSEMSHLMKTSRVRHEETAPKTTKQKGAMKQCLLH